MGKVSRSCHLLGPLLLVGALAAQPPGQARVQTVAGDELQGAVPRADATGLVLVTDQGERTLPWTDVVHVAFGPGTPTGTATPPRLWLRSGQRFPATLEGGDATVGRFRLPFGEGVLELPWRSVAAVRLDRQPRSSDFEDHVAAPPDDLDLLYAQDDSGVRRLSVTVVGIDGDRLVVRFGGQERTLPLSRVHGIVFAARHGVAPEPLPAPRVTVVTVDGTRVTGKPVQLDEHVMALQMAEGPTVTLPRGEIAALEISTDKLLPLTDLVPAIEQTPALDLVWPPLQDRGLAGPAIRLGGVDHRRGLVLFPRTRLTYRLPRGFDVFRVEVGMEDHAGPDANAVCRIEGDGRLLWSATLTAATEPQELELDVQGVEDLVLEADFGEALDLGDACAFAHPQLVRR